MRSLCGSHEPRVRVCGSSTHYTSTKDHTGRLDGHEREGHWQVEPRTTLKGFGCEAHGNTLIT